MIRRPHSRRNTGQTMCWSTSTCPARASWFEFRISRVSEILYFDIFMISNPQGFIKIRFDLKFIKFLGFSALDFRPKLFGVFFAKTLNFSAPYWWTRLLPADLHHLAWLPYDAGPLWSAGSEFSIYFFSKINFFSLQMTILACSSVRSCWKDEAWCWSVARPTKCCTELTRQVGFGLYFWDFKKIFKN